MEFIIIAVVTAVNLIVIKLKVDRKRYEDAAFDFILFVTVTIIFSGTYSGMVVAMIASMIISIYLFASPPTFFTSKLKQGNTSRLDLDAIKKEFQDFDIRGPKQKWIKDKQ